MQKYDLMEIYNTSTPLAKLQIRRTEGKNHNQLILLPGFILSNLFFHSINVYCICNWRCFDEYQDYVSIQNSQ